MNMKKEEEVKKLLQNMNIHTNYLIINQEKNKNDVDIKDENVIICEKYGLSLSRNLAIKNATDDIIIIADDDLNYVEDYDKIIKQAYIKNPDADIICFWVKSKNKKRKVKRMPSSNIGYIKLMRICSFQITMRRKSVTNIAFDEEYGSGTVNNRGEENIFLCDCLRQGLKIKFINKKIAEVEQKESTWYNEEYTKEYFRTQGKIFRRMYPKRYKSIMLQFVIRKYHKYRKNISLKEAVKEIFHE